MADVESATPNFALARSAASLSLDASSIHPHLSDPVYRTAVNGTCLLIAERQCEILYEM